MEISRLKIVFKLINKCIFLQIKELPNHHELLKIIEIIGDCLMWIWKKLI